MALPQARTVPGVGPGELLNDHCEVRATVHRTSSRGAVIGNRTLFAVAHRPQPRHGDATALEVITDRVRAPFAEREVVLGGADAVAVPFDRHVETRVGLQL